MERSQKVAAARRKLKKFQQKSKGETSTGSGDSSPQIGRREDTEPEREKTVDVGVANAKTARMSSSKERLQEMSTEINDMLAESPYVPVNATKSPPANTEHNQTRQLAQALQAQTGLVEDLNQQLQKQANHMGTLHQENIRMRNELQRYREHEQSGIDQTKDLELAGLKEQLKVHVQTIDILVEEKSALQSSCHRHQTLALEKSRECEELMQRLQACHTRVKELEVDTDDLTTHQKKQQQEALTQQKQLSSLQDELNNLISERDEFKQEVQELERRLESHSARCRELEDENSQIKSKLSMSETLVQQLSVGGNSVGELEHALRESRDGNQRLADQLGEVTRLLQTVAAERDHLNHQYTETVEQYEGRVQQLSEQITSLSNDRGALVTHLQQQTALVKELEQKHGDASEEHIPDAIQSELDQLATEKSNLVKQLEARINESEQLRRLTDEQTAEIIQLQATAKRLSEEAVDRTEMMNSMQNDKETISRLLLQHKESKSQLEEMQTGFVKVTNDKMQLASDLQTYKHHNKQLQAKLDEQSTDDVTISEMEGLREEIKQLRDENSYLSQQSLEISRAVSPDHDEVSRQTEKLKQELYASQDTIRQLSAENAGLQNMLLTLHHQTQNESSVVSEISDSSSGSNVDIQNHKTNDDVDHVFDASSQVVEVDAVAVLTARTHELEVERNQMAQELEKQREAFERHLSALRERGNFVNTSNSRDGMVNGEVDVESGDNLNVNDTVLKLEYDQLELNFSQLQDRFVKVMREKAELKDEAQRLEHLVMQLELETDTIGEYISLYHQQRDQLKTKFEQKDELIAALTADKTRIQTQVRELQQLMILLVNEKQDSRIHVPNDSEGNTRMLTPSLVHDGSEASESSLEDEGDVFGEESGHVTSLSPVEFRERQIFDLLQELGRSSRPSGNIYTYDPSVGRVTFFPFTGSCGKEVLVL
ncbi:golgin subfamily A member 2-like [Corticium candelabrum]|uniref:golgin subfamily A member 2-like n=1 Tax=Corticium candelabrum TaxID=121492 RepID=UPI002E274A56|nr:golgin subfamily A member 2-like [Corticium candelabrum]